MIAETATITRKDGSTLTLAREKGRRAFHVLDADGNPTPRSYTRAKLEERPQMDRRVAGIEFERVRPPTREEPNE